MKQTVENKWYLSSDNVTTLVEYLRCKDKYFDFDNVMNILEKPWHYQKEWEEYQTNKKIDEELDAFDRRDK